MLSRLRWLGLETAAPETTRAFYDPLIPDRVDEVDPAVAALGDVETDATNENERGGTTRAADGEALVYRVGGGDPATRLVLRRPRSVPRGGLHTHYALSVPREEYDDWRAHLAADHPVAEHDFGSMRSLYVSDPDGNCVELAGVDVDGPGVDGVFEVVLEVRDLRRARAFYETWGYGVVDEGADRLRLSGPGATPDLELWEPRLGIADARGGVHVDLGVGTPDPAAAASTVRDRARLVERHGETRRVVDPDGHHVTLVAEG